MESSSNRGYNEPIQEWTWSFIPRVSRDHLPLPNCHCNGGQEFYVSICRRKDTSSPLHTDLPTLLAQHYHEVWPCSHHAGCIKANKPPSHGYCNTNPNCPAGAYLPPQQLLIFLFLLSLHMAAAASPRPGNPAVMLGSSKHPSSPRRAKAVRNFPLTVVLGGCSIPPITSLSPLLAAIPPQSGR